MVQTKQNETSPKEKTAIKGTCIRVCVGKT